MANDTKELINRLIEIGNIPDSRQGYSLSECSSILRMATRLADFDEFISIYNEITKHIRQ